MILFGFTGKKLDYTCYENSSYLRVKLSVTGETDNPYDYNIYTDIDTLKLFARRNTIEGRVLGQPVDKNGNALLGRGEELERVCSIDISGLDSRIKDTRFTVMCDVENPLCGVNGATYTFGPQKGAESEMLSRLEKGMINYRDEIKKQFGTDPDSIKGAGAAGGLGAALKIFLRADLRSGIDTLLDLTGFEAALIGADLVITGEGRTDSQTWQGKAVCGIAKRAKEKNVPVMVLSGSIGEGNEIAYETGIKKMVSVMKDGMTPEYAMEHAKELYYNAATEMFKNIKEEWQTWKTNTNSI